MHFKRCNWRTYNDIITALKDNVDSTFPENGSYVVAVTTNGGAPHILCFIRESTYIGGLYQSYIDTPKTLRSVDNGVTWVFNPAS